MRKQKRLLDEYYFPGFRPRAKIQGIFGDPKARVIRLERTQKKRYAVVAEQCIGVITTKPYEEYETCLVAMREFTWPWMCDEYYVESVGK